MKSTIKKTMIGILAAGMVLFIGTTMAFAGGHRGGGHHRGTGNAGICNSQVTSAEENFGQNTTGQNYIDSNNDGICDNCEADSGDCLCGRGTNSGRNYTDSNNDGICDNRTDKSSSGGRRGFCGRNRK